jgi:hypothetical protein
MGVSDKHRQALEAEGWHGFYEGKPYRLVEVHEGHARKLRKKFLERENTVIKGETDLLPPVPEQGTVLPDVPIKIEGTGTFTPPPDRPVEVVEHFDPVDQPIEPGSLTSDDGPTGRPVVPPTLDPFDFLPSRDEGKMLTEVFPEGIEIGVALSLDDHIEHVEEEERSRIGGWEDQVDEDNHEGDDDE